MNKGEVSGELFVNEKVFGDECKVERCNSNIRVF